MAKEIRIPVTAVGADDAATGTVLSDDTVTGRIYAVIIEYTPTPLLPVFRLEAERGFDNPILEVNAVGVYYPAVLLQTAAGVDITANGTPVLVVGRKLRATIEDADAGDAMFIIVME